VLALSQILPAFPANGTVGASRGAVADGDEARRSATSRAERFPVRAPEVNRVPPTRRSKMSLVDLEEVTMLDAAVHPATVTF
jgi:hypothetical protein